MEEYLARSQKADALIVKLTQRVEALEKSGGKGGNKEIQKIQKERDEVGKEREKVVQLTNCIDRIC